MTDRKPARTFFEDLAGRYSEERYGPRADPWRAYFFGERLRHAAELLADAPGPIVDVGAGPGVLGRALGREVLAVDLSPVMLRGRGVAADALRLPLAPASAGAVAALGLTSYLDGLDALLAEAQRVLRPGGRLLVSVTRRAAPDSLLRGLYRATLGRLGGGRGLLRAGIRVRTFGDDEARRAFRRAGFRLLAERRLNDTVFPFAYLATGGALRLARWLERRGLRGLASDTLLLAEPVERLLEPARRPVRVARIITRLNVGGPARQAILLGKRLSQSGYETTLVTGRVADQEGDLTPAARKEGLVPVVLPGLGRSLFLREDLRAFFGLVRLLRRLRPEIVHTHTAKAGTLGRVAAILSGARVRIHTFHGHVLHGYFGRPGSALVRAVELLLARLTTRIVAVSPEVKRDLAHRHGVAPASRISVIPLGLELGPFRDAERHRGELRRELGLPDDAPLIGMAGRLTAIKAPLLAIEVAERVLAEEPEARLLMAGGGELLDSLREEVRKRGLADRILLPGWRDDLPRLWADADLALLTSRNEGTPVALIEAAAAGVPAVATAVGGVGYVVEHGVTGLLAPDGDAEGLAEAALLLLRNPDRRREMGQTARERALRRFSAKRLLRDIDALYRLCL